MRIHVETDGGRVTVEGDDVLAWRGLEPEDAGSARALAEEHASTYVAAHPRPELDAQGAANIPARQRMALLRRLAAGPATRAELLATMRSVGFVGGDDWRNRMDELRGRGKRGGGHTPLPLLHDEEDETYRLTESFAALTPHDREDLAQAKGVLDAAGGLAERGRVLLDALLPDVGSSALARDRADLPSTDVLRRFDTAMRQGRAVRLAYRSRDNQPPATFEAIVPRAYVAGATSVRAYVIRLRPDGTRDVGRQLAIDRLVDVQIRRDIEPAADVFADPSQRITLWVTPAARAALERRSLFELDLNDAGPVDPAFGDLVELTGTFNPELGAEVLRALLTWASAVRVIEPAWLAAGLAVRLAEGLVVQASRPDTDDRPFQPHPGDADSDDRVRSLEEHLGVLTELVAKLQPPAPRRELGGTEPVAPTSWLLDDDVDDHPPADGSTA